LARDTENVDLSRTRRSHLLPYPQHQSHHIPNPSDSPQRIPTPHSHPSVRCKLTRLKRIHCPAGPDQFLHVSAYHWWRGVRDPQRAGEWVGTRARRRGRPAGPRRKPPYKTGSFPIHLHPRRTHREEANAAEKELPLARSHARKSRGRNPRCGRPASPSPFPAGRKSRPPLIRAVTGGSVCGDLLSLQVAAAADWARRAWRRRGRTRGS
jgi:hypothetical protein